MNNCSNSGGTPLISIIVPAYKAEGFLPTIIGDIQAQTFTDWELLVVSNGAGQERQNKIIAEYESRDKRIKAVYLPPPGVANARNEGIKLATGGWIVFVDADDRLTPDHLQLFVNAINDDTDVIAAGFKEVRYKDNYVIANHVFEARRGLDMKVIEGIGVCWSLCIRTSFLMESGLEFPHYVIGEDMTFRLRLFDLVEKSRIVQIPQCGYVYYRRQGSTMSRYAPADQMLQIITDSDCMRRKIALKYGVDGLKVEVAAVSRCYYDYLGFVCNICNPGNPFTVRERASLIEQKIFGNVDADSRIKTFIRNKGKKNFNLYDIGYMRHSSMLMLAAIGTKAWMLNHCATLVSILRRVKHRIR